MIGAAHEALRRVGKGAERAVPTCLLLLKTAFSKPRGLRFAQPTLRNARTKKEAERRQTRVSLLHLPAKRAPWPGRARLSAFHCGSRQGDSWSPRLSVRPCFPGQSGAFDPVRPLQPGSGDLARLHGRYPRRNKSQCSEHLTCRSLCRQADARRRPSAEGTNPLPASTGPAPASPSSPGWRPVRGARQGAFIPCRGTLSRFVIYKSDYALILRGFSCAFSTGHIAATFAKIMIRKREPD